MVIRYVVGSLCVLMLATAPGVWAQRQEVLIPAEKLAPAAARADQPTTGKWWLKRDADAWGAPGGTILLAGTPSDQPLKTGFWDVIPLFRFVPYRVPALTIAPGVTGWYRIHVGVYCDAIDPWSRPMVFGKLDGEPFPEFLQAHAAKGRTAEVYWKAADLTGKKIHLSQPPAPMPHAGAGWMSGITHVRLVPLTDREVADARKEIELPPVERRLFAMLDTTDEIYWYGTAENEDDIRAVVYRHQQAGFGRIYWRCYGTCLDNSLAVPEAAPRWTPADEAAYIKKEKVKAGWQPYIELARKFDPLQVAVLHGKALGCEVHAMVRFANYNRAPYANFWHDHPEFRAQKLATEKDAKGQPVPVKPYRRVAYPRVLSFAHPEVRAYYVKFFKEIAGTGTRGILIDLLRHPPIAGYETIVTESFKKKYSKEMETLNLYRDPQVQEHLSEYLRLFLVDLRKEIGPGIEIGVRSSGPMAYALRGKEWIEQGLINTIVDGHWYSGNGPRPTIAATVEAVGSKGRALAAAEIDDVDPHKNWARRPGTLSPEAIVALARAYSGRGVGNFGLYESTLFTWQPEARRAIRQAGWDFEPKKVAQGCFKK